MYHFDMIVSGIYDTPNGKSESVIVSKAFMEENPEMMNEIAQGREGCGIYDADVIMRDSSMVKERIRSLSVALAVIQTIEVLRIMSV